MLNKYQAVLENLNMQCFVDSLHPFAPRRQWFFTRLRLRGFIKVRSVVQAVMRYVLSSAIICLFAVVDIVFWLGGKERAVHLNQSSNPSVKRDCGTKCFCVIFRSQRRSPLLLR
jgi:hypothetical protein